MNIPLSALFALTLSCRAFGQDAAQSAIDRHVDGFQRAFKAGVKLAMGTDTGVEPDPPWVRKNGSRGSEATCRARRTLAIRPTTSLPQSAGK